MPATAHAHPAMKPTTPLLLLSAALVPATALAGPTVAPIRPPAPRTGADVGKVIIRTVARTKPNGGRVRWKVRTDALWAHGPHQLMILKEATARDGERWLQVQLPIRPSGTTGWIRGDFLAVSHAPYAIEISLRRRLVTIRRGARVVRRFRAVVGAPSTPTPRGLFALYEIVPQANPGGFIGPWALHLTATSRQAFDFGDGPVNRVAIHGRGGTSLQTPLGSAASHGCIRIDNVHVTWMARHLVPGTPVFIRR